MDHPMGRTRLWEAMESCRIGGDDLRDPLCADLAAQLDGDPDLRDKFERLQQSDSLIKAAFAAVPVPAGLAERVSLRLAAARVVGDATPSAESVSDAAAPLRKQPEHYSRRRLLLLGFTSLAAAAGLFAAVWVKTHPTHRWKPDSVIGEAMAYFSDDSRSDGQWFDPRQVSPPPDYSMSTDIVVSPFMKTRWRRIDNLLGGPAVAYDLSVPGRRATLYVFNLTVAGLPANPPTQPISSTNGKSAGAWQVGSVLYVLVVEGNPGDYSNYLVPQGPLT
jgi:hypothetical protein